MPPLQSLREDAINGLLYTQHRLRRYVVPLFHSLLRNEHFFEETLEFLDEAQHVVEQLSGEVDKMRHHPSSLERTLAYGQQLYALFWIRLHGEPWENVSTFWRRGYGLCCLMLALVYLKKFLIRFLHRVNQVCRKSQDTPTSPPADGGEPKVSYSVGTDALGSFCAMALNQKDSFLRCACYYADMGLIMGGLMVEPWDDPVGLKSSILEPPSASFDHFHTQLDTVVYLLHSLFSQDVHGPHSTPSDFQTMTTTLGGSLTKALLFHVLDMVELCAQEKRPSNQSTLLTLATLQSPALATGYTSTVHDTTLLWEISSMTRAERFQTDASLVCRGSSYTAKSWSQRIMTLEDYVQEFLSEGCTAQNGTAPSRFPEALLYRRGTEGSPKGYIAQHPLLDHMPELQQEFPLPDLVAAVCDVSTVIRLVWIGPCHTLSPYHTDSHDNLFTQISGFKIVKLVSSDYPPECFYTSPKVFSNTSTIEPVDLIEHQVDRRRYPLFPDWAQLTCVLGPGDQLYIPKGWWHCVKAMSCSVSYSVWFDV